MYSLELIRHFIYNVPIAESDPYLLVYKVILFYNLGFINTGIWAPT